MRAVLLIINCILFIFGFLFHLSTYFYLEINQYTPILNSFILGVFILGFGLVAYAIYQYKSKGIDFSPLDALNSLPIILKYSIVIFIIVAVVIFFYSGSLLSGGGTQIIDGKYVLADKGVVIKTISEEEYLRFQFIELRMNTIMFLLFNYIIMIGYYYILKPNDD
ncbi:hypothetical protein QE109_01970 [Fusibacter bizertensis]|uniref:DUF5671 domain-containing protein n=1 Tax=Fusibacter bizertensis TaxID=1488331 RepID=A0ABT6N901_9FIRM|nr:hypothetical protein [Fusibacter bizertensis]MDH8676892.1 hypothetical protein [Fusibacter bizertensis]